MDSPLITAHDLRLLSAGYYIQAGIAAFNSVLLFGYSAIATAVLANLGRMSSETGQHGLPPALVSMLSVLLAILLILVAVYTVCLFLAGLWLRRFQNLLFIQIMAGLNCLAIPYGTVLGIFTFMVLQRPSAKQFFANPSMPPPLPTDQGTA
jgi:hypothetical protein